jgi:hydrogenase-1 operon protein HyaF
MHKFPDIPIVEIGPGSQATIEDEGLDYLSMPSGMDTYRPPILPEPEDTTNLDRGKHKLAELLDAMRQWHSDHKTRAIGLDDLDADNLDFVNQALGEGEVSVCCDGPSPIRAQESVLAGVWRVQHFDASDRIIRDSIEIGDVPDMVRNGAFSQADAILDTACETCDIGLQNAPAVLVELADKIAAYQPGDELHAVNLSLLPLTESDIMLLGQRLGVGPVTMLSRGYGNCRIGSTAKLNTWWIKYFNSQDGLILNTIEIVDVPPVARAAPEDIADSIERLDEILELYR